MSKQPIVHLKNGATLPWVAFKRTLDDLTACFDEESVAFLRLTKLVRDGAPVPDEPAAILRRRHLIQRDGSPFQPVADVVLSAIGDGQGDHIVLGDPVARITPGKVTATARAFPPGRKDGEA